MAATKEGDVIKSGDLQNRMASSDQVQEDIQRGKTKRAPEPEQELAARIAAARAVVLPINGHCSHCFGLGRDEAVRAFENWKPE
jgi:hypothetical protein